uniref:Serpentine Receptor, class Z n=1 Tax=Caenorhabditis tropicalis TaxID=1561998 RepID=A0A1I7U4K5_9PELO
MIRVCFGCHLALIGFGGLGFMVMEKFSIIFSISSLAIAIAFFCLIIIVQGFNFLIFFLALQRVLLYFLPESEKILTTVSVKLLGNIRYLYLLLFVKDFLNFVLTLACYTDCGEVWKGVNDIFPLTIFLFLYTSILLSAILYIPIMIHIRKFAHLPMAIESNPQRYILLQTSVILVFKLVCIPVTIPVISLGWNIQSLKYLYMTLDIFAIPLIVQMSYLISNKRNVTVLLSSFKLSNILGLFRKKVNSVTPEPVNSY